MSTTTVDNAARRRRAHGIWLAMYGLTILAVVVVVLRVRETALREMATPEAQAEWQEWREAAPNQNQSGGPVRRRPPSTVEPPALVLLRDHFTVVICGSVLFSSLLFAAIMMAARGVFAADKTKSKDG
jgi:hypothetical protein